jgi:Stress responsive A/B Barrel Domain
MKKQSLVFGTLSLVLLGLTVMNTNTTVADSDAGKLLRHVVLFQFKADLSEEKVQEVVDAFAALPSKISAIVDFEMGTDVSVEGKADGLTHGFVVTFKDAAGRETYLPHPAHKEFVKLVGPRLEKVLVFDYYTAK